MDVRRSADTATSAARDAKSRPPPLACLWLPLSSQLTSQPSLSCFTFSQRLLTMMSMQPRLRAQCVTHLIPSHSVPALRREACTALSTTSVLSPDVLQFRESPPNTGHASKHSQAAGEPPMHAAALAKRGPPARASSSIRTKAVAITLPVRKAAGAERCKEEDERCEGRRS